MELVQAYAAVGESQSDGSAATDQKVTEDGDSTAADADTDAKVDDDDQQVVEDASGDNAAVASNSEVSDEASEANDTRAGPEATAATGSNASAYFHTTITSSSESIANSQYVSFSVKYTIDYGKIKEGDYVDVQVTGALKNVSISVSSQIFAEKIDLGGGRYRLVFNDNAVNGISGSFSVSAFGNNTGTSSTTGTVSVGSVSKDVIVGAGATGGGTVQETRAIVKWGIDGEGYSQDTAVTGVYDNEKDAIIRYAIEVGPKLVDMDGVVVKDTIPSGMSLVPGSIRILPFYPDRSTGPDLSQAELDQIVTVDGNNLTFNFGDRLDGTVYYRVYYKVLVPKGTNAKMKNTATISYTDRNGPNTEASDFTVQPMAGYSNSIGYKSVDKTEISDDPNDQTVTYTITFENDQAFAVGEINLKDKLADNVKFVDAYGSDYFKLSYDAATNTVSISNSKVIPASSVQAVTIVTDFTDVPVGTTIENTVGGNVVKTKKVSGLMSLEARKLVDGQTPDGVLFSFDLLDASGNVLQTVQSSTDGSIKFDPIVFGAKDIGKTYTYQVRESQSQPYGYSVDSTVYYVSVTPQDSDGDGILECNPVIVRNGQKVADMTFNNKTLTTSVSVVKRWVGPAADSVEVELYADSVPTGNKVTLTADGNWTGSFQNLKKYRTDGTEVDYTVVETEMDNYDSSVEGSMQDGFVITNTNIETVEVSGQKTWNDDSNRDGLRPESISVSLLKNGEVVDTQTVTAAMGWKYTFSGLAKYDADGSLVSYAIQEAAVKGYTMTRDSSSGNSYDITNTHQIETISIPVHKSWVGPEAESVTVRLLADGVDTNKSVVLNKDNGWSASFDGLPKYRDGGKAIEYTVSEDAIDNYTSEITGKADTGFVITNTNTETVTVSGVKTWNDSNDQDGKRPSIITVKLLKDGKVSQTKQISADDNWTYEFTGLQKYNSDGSECAYAIDEVSVEGYQVNPSGYNLENSYTPEEISVSVAKAWEDADNQDGIRPTSVKVQLLANGSPMGDAVELSASNSWFHVWTGLAKYSNGSEVEYSVEEVGTPSGYNTAVTGDVVNGFTITNTHVPETTSVSVEKNWDGPVKDSATVYLFANGAYTGQSVELNAANGWKHVFDGLAKRDNGVDISYTVMEKPVDNYNASVSGSMADGFVITNANTETIDIPVSKTWTGPVGDSVTVTLYKNGVATDKSIVLSAENGWFGAFESLEKYASDGTAISYSVVETNVPAGYVSAVKGEAATGFTIENTNTETISIDVSKTWVGPVGGAVTVELIRDGVATGETVELNEANGWKAQFSNLQKYYASGAPVYYSVAEKVMDNYSSAISGNQTSGFVITNTNTETVDVAGQKTWNDDGDRDGIRPSELTVKLFKNGAEEATFVTSESQNWGYSFTGLPKYDANGNEYVYTIAEEDVEGYEGSVEGYDLVNTHDPETTNLKVTKNWVGEVGASSVIVRLMADGVVTSDFVVLNEENGWTGSFDNLPVYRDGGERISYFVAEDKVDNYYPNYGVASDGSIVITNIQYETIVKWLSVSIPVAKVWNGPATESVTVELYANGAFANKTLELNAENNWSGSFDYLARYDDNGDPIEYSVKEVAVDNYESVVDGSTDAGFVITNTNTEKTSVSGVKTWDDANNQDGKRPDSITVNLIANGEKVDSKTVTAADGWAYAFDNLDKYAADGKQIEYAVTEDAVADYSTTIDGFDIVNTYTPGKTSVSVSKTWDDDSNRDGIRPESVSVQLMANGQPCGDPVELSSANAWTYVWSGLDEMSEGSKIDYTVEETEVPEGYTVSVSGDAVTGYQITNGHQIEVISIPVQKRWDGPVGSSVTVRLLANGAATGESIELSDDTEWKGSFDNLPRFENGAEIDYTVEEIPVENYVSEVEGDAANGFVVTNRFVSGVEEPEDSDVPASVDEPNQTDSQDQADSQEGGDKKVVPVTGDNTILGATLFYSLIVAGATLIVTSRLVKE